MKASATNSCAMSLGPAGRARQGESSARLLTAIAILLTALACGALFFVLVINRRGDVTVAPTSNVEGETDINARSEGRGVSQVSTQADDSALSKQLEQCLEQRLLLEETVGALERQLAEAGLSTKQSMRPDGTVEAEWTERSGVKEGLYTEWYPDGQRKCVGSYLAGKKIGQWKYFDEHGNVQMKGTWNGDVRDGIWWTFDHTVNSRARHIYSDGELLESSDF